MTSRLEQAFHAAPKLLPAEQDALADMILAEAESDAAWGLRFTASAETLGRLADEALDEHRCGQTEDLDLDRR